MNTPNRGGAAETHLATERFAHERGQHLLAELVFPLPKLEAHLAFHGHVLVLSTQSAEPTVSGQLSARGRLLDVLQVSQFGVDGNKELRKRIGEFSGEQPLVQSSEEWFGDL